VVPRSDRDDDFRLFYGRMQDRALATARRLTGDATVAEDLAAEALARAYAHWRRVRRHPNPEAWLMRVVGNLAIDHLRAAERRTTPVDLRDDGPALDLRHGSAGAPTSRSAEHGAVRVDVVRAIVSLPHRQQEVVVMRYLADLSEEDTAAALGVSAGSVKTHLSRASARLREQLGADVLVDVTAPTTAPDGEHR
jgi:RNA polymerase sigma-70 factor (sigma-E family)